jgi:hypothetical protein
MARNVVDQTLLATGSLRLQFAGGLPCGSCRAAARYD